MTKKIILIMIFIIIKQSDCFAQSFAKKSRPAFPKIQPEISMNHNTRMDTTYRLRLVEHYDDLNTPQYYLTDHYEYDVSGRTITFTQRDASGTVIRIQHISYTAANLIADIIDSSFYGNWGVNKRIYTYDSVGHMLSVTTQKPDSLHVFTNLHRTSYTYDSHGYQTSYIDEEFKNSVWEIYWGQRELTVYNANELLTSKTFQDYSINTNMWENFSRELYTYNNQDLLASQTTQNFSGTWQNTDKLEYYYDSNRDLIERIYYSSNSVQWFLVGRTTNIQWFNPGNNFEYNDNMETFTDQWWNDTAYVDDRIYTRTRLDSFGSAIRLFDNKTFPDQSSRSTILYDSLKNQIEEKLEGFDNLGWYIYGGFQAKIDYDNHANKTQQIDYEWSDPNAAFIFKEKRLFFYDKNHTGINKKILSKNILVYPNPAREKTNIKFQTSNESLINIDVYNVVGQKVNTIVNEILPAGEHEYKIENLKTGIYLVRIAAGNNMETKKLIIH
jgi:hypothetical protein